MYTFKERVYWSIESKDYIKEIGPKSSFFIQVSLSRLQTFFLLSLLSLGTDPFPQSFA
jgi:hypothetical protein